MAAGPGPMKVKLELDETSLREQLIEVLAGHAVIKPGETLVIRVKDWPADQIEAYQDYLAYKQLPFRVLVVAGDELAVARPDGA